MSDSINALVPNILLGILEYLASFLKKSSSAFKALATGTLLLISYWLLFLTPIYPNLNLISSFNNILEASEPSPMISILVITPIVLIPSLSHSLANFRDNWVDKS